MHSPGAFSLLQSTVFFSNAFEHNAVQEETEVTLQCHVEILN